MTWKRLRLWGRQRRYLIRRNPRLYLIYRISVGVVGTLVLLGGVIAIPYPGPGWLILFLGLGILASEFAWARRVLVFVRGKYDAWVGWIGRQHWSVQALVWTATAAIVVLTLWLLGAVNMVAGWVHIHDGWLASPLFS